MTRTVRMTVYLTAECDVPGFEQVIKGRDVGSPSVRHPPLSGVLIVELYLTHHLHIVPISKYDL